MKKLYTFILLSLIFFTLFSFPASFAAYNQDSIMSNLAKGKPLCSLSKEDTEEFKKQEGHCFGFSAVWLYSKWLQFTHPEKVSVYDGDWYKSTVEDILGSWSNCSNIKKFGSLVKKLHDSQTVGNFEEEINQLDVDGKKLHREYSIASLLTFGQLKQLLSEIIIYDHKLIFVHSHSHVTAIFKDGDAYYYFDPNGIFGEYKLSSIDEVADRIFYANYFDFKKPSPIALQVFSYDEKIQNYPTQQDILDRINPSLIAEKNYADEYTGLHEAAYTGCLESIRYFLINKKVDAEQVGIHGDTALMWAARNGHFDVVELLLNQTAYIAKTANIDRAADDGLTALMVAAKYGHHEIVRLLLQKGASPNTPKEDNR